MSASNMLLMVAVFVFASVWQTSLADECVYDDRGLCMYSCPPDTVSYVSSCGNEEAQSQRTCRQPVARSIGTICDLSRCDCTAPKVWDEAEKKCVLLQDCSDQTKARGDNDFYQL